MVHLEMESFGTSVKASAAPSLEPSQLVVSEALFVKELCDLLICLEVASPASGKEIACLPSEKAPEDKIKKMKEYLRSESKKSGVTRKSFAAT
jgi:hypothetical protein